MKGIYLIYLVVPLLVLICWHQSSALTPKEQLTQLKQEMKKKREALALTRAKGENASKRINTCQRQAQEKTNRIREKEMKISLLDSGIKTKRKELTSEQVARENRHQVWQSRLSSYYRISMAETPLLSGIIVDIPVFRQNDFVPLMRKSVTTDHVIIAAHEQKIGTIRQETGKLEVQKNSHVKEWNISKQELSAIEKEKATQQEQLAATRKEQEKLAAEIKEFEDRQKRLESLLASVQKKIRSKNKAERKSTPSQNSDLNRKQVLLPPDFPHFNLPVAGKIIRGYGVYEHPVWHTKTFRNGITIAAPAGSQVRAIASGTVAYSGNLKGYGNMMIIDHGKNVFSVYGHCWSLLKKVGTNVSINEAIATVGVVDELTSILYFEVRYKGKSVNPIVS